MAKTVIECVVLLVLSMVQHQSVSAWQIQPPTRKQQHHNFLKQQELQKQRRVFSKYDISTSGLSMTEQQQAEEVTPAVEFTEDELSAMQQILDEGSEEPLEEKLVKVLSSWDPSLIMRLREVYKTQHSESEVVKTTAEALNNVLDSQLTSARDLLKELLSAGELRKLDATIGKAAREGKLDAAFFNVLNMNMKDAAAESASNEEEGTASRVQILQHVYTRCQEEVEKTIPPGLALLNKLLRTDMEDIRRNQLEYYLCPQPNVITTPDGKELTLENPRPVSVEPQLLVDAIANTIKQIRTVENSGGTDRVTAASMVESCRIIAKEARLVLGENYGPESEEVKNFEEGLQPVFRPMSPDSEYIKGE